MPGHLSGNWVLGQPDVGMGTEKSQAVGTKQPQGESWSRKSGEPRGRQRWWRGGVLEPVTEPRGPELVGAVSAGHHPHPTHPGTPWAPLTDR